MTSKSSQSADELQNYCHDLENYCESLKDTIRLIGKEFHDFQDRFLKYQQTMDNYWAAQQDIEQAEKLQTKARQKQDEMFVGFLHADIDRQVRNAVTRKMAGKQSGESRRKKRIDDLEIAAQVLNRLESAYPIKKFFLKDISAASGIDLSRLQKLTMREIRWRASSLN